MTSFGNLPDVSQWGQYKISEMPLTMNGGGIKYKAILQNGALAQISSNKYTVLPNEEAAKIAEQAAKEVGMVPFSKFAPEDTKAVWARFEDNVIYDRWRVHCLYAINQPYEVNGDKMYIGVGIHNSIDGSTPFGAGIFTFRHACTNMVLAGSKGYTQSFDERATIDYIYKRHVGQFDLVIGDLTVKITNLMDKATGIIEAYKQMAQKKADEAFRKTFLEGLKKNEIAKKWLPDYLKVEKDQTLLPMAKGLTVWDVYNDITANVWHDPKKSALASRIDTFDKLHKLIPLTVA